MPSSQKVQVRLDEKKAEKNQAVSAKKTHIKEVDLNANITSPKSRESVKNSSRMRRLKLLPGYYGRMAHHLGLAHFPAGYSTRQKVRAVVFDNSVYTFLGGSGFGVGRGCNDSLPLGSYIAHDSPLLADHQHARWYSVNASAQPCDAQCLGYYGDMGESYARPDNNLGSYSPELVADICVALYLGMSFACADICLHRESQLSPDSITRDLLDRAVTYSVASASELLEPVSEMQKSCRWFTRISYIAW
ncbi:hypothetical protein C8J57DRAFT_1583466 [Mycena rebaudengoi]|nr:hypothetical protein C8J57DRAFT_1583466 [Mycena rebaudengoi]